VCVCVCVFVLNIFIPRDRTFPSGALDGSFAAPENGSLMGPRHSMFQRRGDRRAGPGNILPR